jgi:hypothetical protein
MPLWSAKSRAAWLENAAAPDPLDVFKRECEVIAYYLDLPAEHGAGIVATLALWVVLTYLYPAWDAVPYLYVGGPLGSGKSRLFEILIRLVWRPVNSSNMTASALFRRLHDRGGVLLLDEAERLRESTPDATELRSILLAGYKRGGKAMRNEPLGDGRFKQIEFDVYGPKAVACIVGLPPALISRCIQIIMFRSAPGSEKPKRRINEDPRRWASLRDDLHILALEHGGEFLELSSRTDACPAMSGRNYELWQPLMVLAKWFEGHGVDGLLAIVQAHARYVIDSNQDDQTPEADETILRLLAEAVMDLQTPTPAELLAKAKAADAETFKQWHATGISRVLKRYGILSRQSHGVRAYRDVKRADMIRIQMSYGIDLGIETPPAAWVPLVPAPVTLDKQAG